MKLKFKKDKTKDIEYYVNNLKDIAYSINELIEFAVADNQEAIEHIWTYLSAEEKEMAFFYLLGILLEGENDEIYNS